jgi:hypothetical protein
MSSPPASLDEWLLDIQALKKHGRHVELRDASNLNTLSAALAGPSLKIGATATHYITSVGLKNPLPTSARLGRGASIYRLEKTSRSLDDFVQAPQMPTMQWQSPQTTPIKFHQFLTADTAGLKASDSEAGSRLVDPELIRSIVASLPRPLTPITCRAQSDHCCVLRSQMLDGLHCLLRLPFAM